MNRLKLAAGVILIFLVGALVGALGSGMYFKNRIERFSAGGPPPHTRKIMVMKRLSQDLDLSEDQHREIEKIVEATENKLLAIRRQYLPEIKETLDSGLKLMKGKLTAGQQKKLAALKEKLEDRHARAYANSILTRRNPDSVLSMLRQRLKLSQDQETRIREIVKANIEKRRQLVEKHRRQDRPEIFSLRREFRELQRVTEENLAGVLTPEQLAEYGKFEEDDRLERRREMGRKKFEMFTK